MSHLLWFCCRSTFTRAASLCKKIQTLTQDQQPSKIKLQPRTSLKKKNVHTFNVMSVKAALQADGSRQHAGRVFLQLSRVMNGAFSPSRPVSINTLTQTHTHIKGSLYANMRTYTHTAVRSVYM